MSEEEQAQIFHRFYQVSSSTGGAGLGLAICKQLVEIQGGSISVESELGSGSQFHFELPMA
jgi:signal transduction histidine kinase